MQTTKKTLSGPGKSYREGITLIKLFQLFPDDETAERWLENRRWGKDGPKCPRCESRDRVNECPNRKPASYWCGACRQRFNVRTKTALEGSKISYQKWVIAMYLHASSLKGVSSMKLHRDIGITQKSAWFMSHRLREGMSSIQKNFIGPVEIDESYFGGKERNKHNRKKAKLGRGPVGKTAVVGAKDRATNLVQAEVVMSVDKEILNNFVDQHTDESATIYTDGSTAYRGRKNHEYVRHSVREYVLGQVHTNGVESFWASLKRGYYGIYHHISPKHLHRYVQEFTGRHNFRRLDTIEQMGYIANQLFNSERLTYKTLIAE